MLSNYKILLSSLFIIGFGLLSKANAQTQWRSITGQVSDEDHRPLELVTIYVEELDMRFATDSKGQFNIQVPNKLNAINIRITSVGRKAIRDHVVLGNLSHPLEYTLLKNSLTLKEVTVSPVLVQGAHSNSSIIFDEEAIERTQAFSLMDVLKGLPGKASSAPNINAPQTLTLRGNLDGAYSMNNSLGIPIIMDGVNLSNDANMQSRSVSQFGMAGSILNGAKGSSKSDVPFQGIDLRDIPVENIERIEVIQGVASAEYGELTDGAVIVETKAGGSPYQFTTNVNGASSNFSLSKGYNLPHELGGLNIGLNYAKSNTDPRDRLKQYDRYGVDLKWSKGWKQSIRNTLSLHISRKADNYQSDPDDNTLEASFSRDHKLRLSNRFNWNINKRFVRTLNLTLSYNRGRQHSYKQWLLNSGVKPYSYKDTTGIYEGVLLSGRYMAQEEILGRPETGSAHLKLSTAWGSDRVHHAFSYGAQFNYSNNGGKGIIADPDRPRWVGSANQNARPYAFEQVPTLMNLGLYAMDNIKFTAFNKEMHANIGMRFDRQNGSSSLQPRVNMRMMLNSNWSTDVAFGMSSKSPTLAHRYPAPTWLDIPLVLAYNSQDALYLVYTQKYIADNSQLKPSKSMQVEYGLNYRSDWGSLRLNAYYKANRDGFNGTKTFHSFHLPNYETYVDPETGKFEYQPDGTYRDIYNLGNYSIQNITSSNNFGLDLLWNLKEFEALSTSIYGNTALIYSQEDGYPDLVPLAAPIEINAENVWYGIYPRLNEEGTWALTSKISTTTHIPKLGFILMSTTDIFWMARSNSLRDNPTQEAIGYVDAGQQWHYITPQQAKLFPVRDLSLTDTSQPFVYASFNLSVAKEIKKRIRISITAYNVLNIRPEFRRVSETNSEKYQVQTYNSPVSLTGGISFKF